MKLIVGFWAVLTASSLFGQPSEVKARIRQVEEQLAPEVVSSDSILRFNLLQRMKFYRVKGLSIAVIKNYKIEWAKGYGWADEEDKRMVTPSTRFQAASISKSLNSVGILKLVQDGKVDLDADINNYLRSWKFPYDSISKGKKITLRNLLSHTAGLNVHGFRGYQTNEAIPTLVQILDGIKPANSPAIRSIVEPSVKFEYSGGGTTISQVLLMDVTGMAYENYMKKEVLDKIGMSNSFFNQPPPAGTKDLATAYYNNGKSVKGKYHIYPEQAAAGLWTTPTDLAKYIIETQLSLEGKSNRVLSAAMTKKRLTPVIDSAVGLGSFMLQKGDDTYFSHNGGNEGFLCTSYGSMHNGNGVVVMINSGDFQILPEVVNSVGIVYGWKGFYKPEIKKVQQAVGDSIQAQKPAERKVYQVKVYHFSTLQQKQNLDAYLESAFLPALHRNGISVVGVFMPIANDTALDKKIYIIIPVKSLTAIVELEENIWKDDQFLKSGINYLDALYTNPPFTRMENIILRAFTDAPKLTLPELKGPKADHIYELRSYESSTEKLYHNKVKMFNEGGEVTLFKQLNFNAIFYGEVLAGSSMPNLMYMTSFENMKERDAHWKDFGDSPVWKKLSSDSAYQHNVSKADIILMKAAPYSDY